MHIIISSALGGRDLALVKSMVNIMDADASNTWKYQQNTIDYDLFITRDVNHEKPKYYAICRHTGKKTRLGSMLNPCNIKKLFEDLASHSFSLESGQTSGLTNRQRSNLDQYAVLFELYSYMNSDTSEFMIVEYDDLDICIDRNKYLLYSTKVLTRDRLKDVIAGSCSRKSRIKFTSDLDSRFMGTTAGLQLKEFLWCYGIMCDTALLDSAFESKDHSFKQKGWPNYGTLKCDDSFIDLSSMLSRRSRTFEGLMNFSGCSKKHINSFLNATCLTGYCSVSESHEQLEYSPTPVSESQSFFYRLKNKLFGIAQRA